MFVRHKTEWSQVISFAALALILMVAGFLRLNRLDLVEFKADEASMLNLATAFLETGKPPLIGIASSTGLPTPPIMVYVMSVLLLFTRNVALASGLVALANLLAVFLTYRFTARYFGPRAALVATLLFATGFWMVIHARKIWDVSMLPLATILFVSALFAWIVAGKRSGLLWSGLWAGLVLQFHLSALAYVPLLALLLLLYRRRWEGKALAGAAGLLVLPWTPYLWWHLADRGQTLQAFLTSGLGGEGGLDLKALEFTTLLLSSGHYRALLGVSAPKVTEAFLGLEALQTILNILFIFAMAVIAGEALRSWRARSGDHRYRLLLLWLAVPILVFLYHPYTLYVHYFVQVFPAAFVVLGVGLVAFFDRAGPWLAAQGPRGRPRSLLAFAWAALGLFLVLYAASQSWLSWRLLSWVEELDTFRGYGVPLKVSLEAVQQTERIHSGSPSPAFLLGDEEMDPVLRFLAVGRVPFRVVDGTIALPFPGEGTAPTTYLLTSERSPAARYLGERFAGGLRAQVPYPGGADTFLIYQIPPGVGREATAGLPQLPYRFETGVQLLGYGLAPKAQAGQPLTLTLVWTLEEALRDAAKSDLRFYNHLLDPRGQKRGQFDGIGYRSQDWRPGDVVVNWFPLPVPPRPAQGLYSVELGLYDLGTMARMAVQDSQTGGSIDAIRLGPVRVRPAAGPPPLAHRTDTRFGENVALLGYALEGSQQAGDVLMVRLFWQARQPLSRDYTVFVHLVDAESRLLAQHDSYPADGLYPTTAWEPQEVVEDLHPVVIPKDATGQRISIVVGLYWLGDLKRVPVLDEAGGVRGDALPLLSFVGRPP